MIEPSPSPLPVRVASLAFATCLFAAICGCQPSSETPPSDEGAPEAPEAPAEPAAESGSESTEANAPSAPVDFVADVKPLLESQCIRCHNSKSLFGGFNLETREKAMAGGTRGVVIIPGDPEASRVYQVALMPADTDHAMPATGAKLTLEQKEILRRWIADGAKWPDDTPLEYLDPDAIPGGQG